MVGSLEVRNLELDVLGAVVLPGLPEGNWQDHLTQCNSRVPRDDVVERRCALGEHVSDVELHLLQGLGEKNVEPAPTVDEYLIESGARDYWFQDEWKTP
jgi:hypothetical protein